LSISKSNTAYTLPKVLVACRATTFGKVEYNDN